MATPTDDNAADGNLDKYRVRLIWRRYTSVTLVASSYPYLSCKVIWFSKSNSSKNLFTLSKIIIARPPSHWTFLIYIFHKTNTRFLYFHFPANADIPTIKTVYIIESLKTIIRRAILITSKKLYQKINCLDLFA